MTESIRDSKFDSTETLIRTIDILSLEILRLNTELKLLQNSQKSNQEKKADQKMINYHESIFKKTIRYQKIHGLRNTLRRIKRALRGGHGSF